MGNKKARKPAIRSNISPAVLRLISYYARPTDLDVGEILVVENFVLPKYNLYCIGLHSMISLGVNKLVLSQGQVKVRNMVVQGHLEYKHDLTLYHYEHRRKALQMSYMDDSIVVRTHHFE